MHSEQFSRSARWSTAADLRQHFRVTRVCGNGGSGTSSRRDGLRIGATAPMGSPTCAARSGESDDRSPRGGPLELVPALLKPGQAMGVKPPIQPCGSKPSGNVGAALRADRRLRLVDRGKVEVVVPRHQRWAVDRARVVTADGGADLDALDVQVGDDVVRRYVLTEAVRGGQGQQPPVRVAADSSDRAAIRCDLRTPCMTPAPRSRRIRCAWNS